MSVGMDIFISADWPREFYHFLQDSDLAMLKSEGKPGVSVGSSYIAEVYAMHLYSLIHTYTYTYTYTHTYTHTHIHT